MSISVLCPGCEKRLKAKDEMAGKRVKCPNCGQMIVIQEVGPACQQVTTTSPSATKSPPRKGSQATVPSAPASKPVRWPWYAGGGAAFLCVLAVVAFLFAMPGKNRTPAKNDLAAVKAIQPEPKSEPKPEPKSEPKPEPKPEPRWKNEKEATLTFVIRKRNHHPLEPNTLPDRDREFAQC